MIINLYDELMSYYEVRGDMKERLRKWGIEYVFHPLMVRYPEDELFNKILYYIIRIYSSKGNDELIVGIDMSQFKNRVYNELELPDDAEFKNGIMHLQNSSIAITIQNYLEYQQSSVFKHYMTTLELYNEMLLASLLPLKTGEEIDYRKKFNCSEDADKLWHKVEKWEIMLKSELGNLPGEEVKKVKNAAKNNKQLTLGVEDYATK